MIRPRSGSYAVSVYDPSLKRKRWVGTYKTLREADGRLFASVEPAASTLSHRPWASASSWSVPESAIAGRTQRGEGSDRAFEP